MLKNAWNELKFGPNIYFYVFYQVLEDLCKIFKTGQFMAEKLSFSVFFGLEIVAIFQWTKNVKKCLEWTEI